MEHPRPTERRPEKKARGRGDERAAEDSPRQSRGGRKGRARIERDDGCGDRSIANARPERGKHVRDDCRKNESSQHCTWRGPARDQTEAEAEKRADNAASCIEVAGIGAEPDREQCRQNGPGYVESEPCGGQVSDESGCRRLRPDPKQVYARLAQDALPCGGCRPPLSFHLDKRASRSSAPVVAARKICRSGAKISLRRLI